MKLLKYKKFTGLHVVCKKCSKHIEVSQEPYDNCTHPLDRQKYKAIVKKDGKRRTKDLAATEYNEAVKELLQFRDEVLNPMEIKFDTSATEKEYTLLSDYILLYSDWLENVDVPKFEQKMRSSKYIKETIGYVLKLSEFLKGEGYSPDKLSIHSVDKHMLGDYYDYLKTTVKSPATFNHHLRAIKGFYNFLINEKELLVLNIPKKMKLLYENPNPVSVGDDEFKALLSKITPEDSVEVLKSGKRKNRFRSYTKSGIELCAYTGMRLEEAVSIKYSDIVADSNKNLEYLTGVDLKFERAHNWDNTTAQKTVNIPLSPELEDLLNRLNYRENIGSDKYLIASDENISRASLAKQLSHSFTFYRRKAGLGDGFSIKHLRKTFLTKLHLQTGLTESMGYQKTAHVVLKNYIDKRAVVKEVNKRGFRLFNVES